MIKMTDQRFPVVRSLPDLRKLHHISSVCAAVGVFDGVHVGHCKLLRELRQMAEEVHACPVAITFDPHPRQVLTPDKAPALLLPPAEKYRYLFENGAEAVVVIPFDKTFASLEPQAFLSHYVNVPGIALHGLCVGTKWRFGANGKGTCELLTELAEEAGIRFIAVPEETIDGETVSSTSIRLAASSGDLAKAERFLGRSYELYGPVIHGHGVATTTLTCPTANIDVRYGVLPPNGVYAARIRFDGKTEQFPAVINIGFSPTFHIDGQEDELRVEAHFLTPCGDIYGRYLALHPVSYLRPERQFSSPET